jgi:hypothetical protein
MTAPTPVKYATIRMTHIPCRDVAASLRFSDLGTDKSGSSIPKHGGHGSFALEFVGFLVMVVGLIMAGVAIFVKGPLGSDFNHDFNVWFTEEQWRKGVEYNYRREPVFVWRAGHDGGGAGEEAIFAAMCGTHVAAFHRDRPGMSAFTLEHGVVYQTYSAYARGLDGLWGMCLWLDRAPKGAQRDGRRLVAPP